MNAHKNGTKEWKRHENHKPFSELLIVYMMLFGKHANISIRIMQSEREEVEERKKHNIIIQAYECRLAAARHGFAMQTHLPIR